MKMLGSRDSGGDYGSPKTSKTSPESLENSESSHPEIEEHAVPKIMGTTNRRRVGFYKPLLGSSNLTLHIGDIFMHMISFSPN
jgi:hypothetical protein